MPCHVIKILKSTLLGIGLGVLLATPAPLATHVVHSAGDLHGPALKATGKSPDSGIGKTSGVDQLDASKEALTALVARAQAAYDPKITGPEILAFLKKAKTAATSKSKDLIVALFHFPLRCNICAPATMIMSKEALEQHYDDIVTPQFLEALATGRLESLFVNYQGFMMGDGQIWFDPSRGILAVNAPL